MRGVGLALSLVAAAVASAAELPLPQTPLPSSASASASASSREQQFALRLRRRQLHGDACVTDPVARANATRCGAYMLPSNVAVADAAALCVQMPEMPGCHIREACMSATNASSPSEPPYPSDGSADYCTPWRWLRELCVDMPTMGDCQNYNALCAAGSAVAACAAPPLMGLPTTTGVSVQLGLLCYGSAASTAACGAWNSDCGTSPSCDQLGHYGAVCSEVHTALGRLPTSGEPCNGWANLCLNLPEWDPLCTVATTLRAPSPPPSSSPMSPPSSSSSSSGGLPACVEDPTSAGCASYTYPSALARSDIADLCDQMPFMVGCTVDALCKSDDAPRSSDAEDDYCTDFHVLKELCVQMPGMSGCASYNSMCSTPGSTVRQCRLQSTIGLPGSMEIMGLVSQLCSSHAMDGCTEFWAECDPSPSRDCDPLTIYSELCQAMPDMVECRATGSQPDRWDRYCENIPDWSLCRVGDETAALRYPIMRMYFHGGILDYILFEWWVPRTIPQFILSNIAVFLFAIMFEALKAYRAYVESHWAARAAARQAKAARSNNANSAIKERLDRRTFVVDMATLEPATRPAAAAAAADDDDDDDDDSTSSSSSLSASSSDDDGGDIGRAAAAAAAAGGGCCSSSPAAAAAAGGRGDGGASSDVDGSADSAAMHSNVGLLADDFHARRDTRLAAEANGGEACAAAAAAATPAPAPSFWVYLTRTPVHFLDDTLRAWLHGIEVTVSLLVMLIAMVYNWWIFGSVVLGAIVGNWLFTGRTMHGAMSPGSCH